MRAAFAALFFVTWVSACSSESAGTSSTGGPSPTAPEGAVNMEVYATPVQSCPPGNFHIDIGNTKTMPPALVVDGWESATVSCAVIPMSGKFAASGAVKQGALDFSFQDVLTDGSSAIGTVSFVDPSAKASGRYTSPGSMPCVFQFAPGTGQGVSTGKVWMQFDCSSLVSEVDATKSCSSRYGYVLVDRCATK